MSRRNSHITQTLYSRKSKQDDLWINILQVQEAHLSTRGKQIIVPDSGHMIPFKRPDAVIDAIREVWDSVASK